jgi:cytochrome c-type biogenesis protein CcmH
MKTLWFGTTAFVLLVAAGGYAWKGSPSLALNPVPAQAAAAAAEPGANDLPGGMDPAQFEQAVQGLRQRLETQERDNPEGWAVLARSYMVLGRNDDAITAFERATALAPNDAGLIADHANVIAQREGMAAGGRAVALLDKALAIDARQPKALALAGIAAFERQDYAAAVRRWEAALEVMPDHPFAAQMRDGIAQAKQALGALGGGGGAAPTAAAAPGAAAAAPGTAGSSAAAPPQTSAATSPTSAATSPTSASAGTVEGRVSLAPALATKASPDDTVFVFARAAQGPRMPLAILRKQVKDLPFDFKLDDAMAMSPQTTLSSVPKVIVGARISKTGNAIAQAGDLQGLSKPVDVGAKGLAIVIDEVVGP